jgi:aspartate/methionine/tyrosine aminotransferase
LNAVVHKEVAMTSSIEARFARLSTDNAPGQEVRQAPVATKDWMRGEALAGESVDFSHGDVDEDAFPPTPGAKEIFDEGVRRGGSQAYTEYRGDARLREAVAQKLADFTGRPVSGERELIITPGTQGALFLAVAACAGPGDKVAIVRPDYFANRKIVEFLGAETVPVRMDYLAANGEAGLDLTGLESAFRSGAKTFLFSNPNNPAGVVYSRREIDAIAALATRHGATVIVDQLYSRQRFPGCGYTHLRAADIDPQAVVTIMGPSKTESLSGYRLGVAFGGAGLIERMEKLQAIVSLRAAGYCQAVLSTWFDEPAGWLAKRVDAHRGIRDDLLATLRGVHGMDVRTPDAGSYLFPQLPALGVSSMDFIRALRIQAGVTVTPGTEFSPDAQRSIRLNFSQNRVRAVDAVRRLVTLVERYRAA